MKSQSQNPVCPFCEGMAAPVYKMDNYVICRCAVCGTGQVSPMPTDDELQEFYKGFLFEADLKNLETILKSAPKLFSLLGLEKDSGMKMLDVGGGGGFYAKAFESAGYGESTYIDLDSEACGFARARVGLKNVLHQDAAMLKAVDGRYDFIMCRHLIEHLADPATFILNLTRLLNAGGTLLLICPNGDSLEYFAYPNSNLKSRIKKIGVSSHLSQLQVVLKLLSGKMLHGIDPPRHLWAVSRKGMQRFLHRNAIPAEITTFPLTDALYSPYYSSRTRSQKLWSLLGDKFAAKISGGTHLSVVIRKSRNPEDEHVV